ncbi:MAG: hypothetical protein QOG42_2701 [Solirubrobacteraceae bacterium]|jgi:AcrR family transcriptional regulator|nr:hypothetical protein [Solirubrobacteraceae bacterium]
MSLRLLNRDLGLSHGTINQRFGSKERLYYAAVDYGFGGLVAEMTDELERRPEPGDDLALVRESIRAFLVASARRPELVRLMQAEGLADSDRLHYIFETFIGPTLAGIEAAYDRLAEAGSVRPLSTRAWFFLIAHGAAAPYTLTALSRHFDVRDGPLDDAAHAEQMTDVIIAGLRT